ncbi:MAG: hypothetical protein KAT47_05030 [Candidatus Aegiribacteria sp.]|nr:hypothetical protein [Candidatus Aegiribacteria sp.]
MKCLKVKGEPAVRGEFISRFCAALSDRVICVISTNLSGESEATFPGESSIEGLLESLPPDLAIIPADSELIVPIVDCGCEVTSMNPLVLAAFHVESADTDYAAIYRNTFHLLPQKTEKECGRCGMDCRRMAEAILRGDRREEDCFYAPGRIEITVDGRPLKVGKFPAEMIEGSLRGLLSSMKGYREDSDILIKLRPMSIT